MIDLFTKKSKTCPSDLGCKYQSLFAHPGGDALVHASLEGGAEGAVAVVAALLGQLLGGEGLL